MRLVILGLDAVDPLLAENWHLVNLLQEYHGVWRPPESKVWSTVYTPEIWAAIATGLPPEEHGIQYWYVYRSRLVETIRRIKRRLPLIRRIPVAPLLEKLGLLPKRRLVDKRDLRAKTVFDEVPSIVVTWPAYNEPEDPHRDYERALQEEGVKGYIQAAWKWHRWRLARFTRALEEFVASRRYVLLSAWFDLADIVGHACIAKCRQELIKAYFELDRLVRMVRDKLPPDTVLLVLSDHGMDAAPDGTGIHAPRALWSLNARPPFEPKTVDDVARLVRVLLEA